MAQRKRISLETEPHVYDIDFGDRVVELRFVPEVFGSVYADATAQLVDEQTAIRALEDRRAQDSASDAALRRFLATFMEPESREQFVKWDETGEYVTDRLDLPTWVVADMVGWVAEVYGRRDPTKSSSSASSPSNVGQPSTAAGRSKASTRRAGRSRG